MDRTHIIFILLILVSSHMCAGQARTYFSWGLSHDPSASSKMKSPRDEPKFRRASGGHHDGLLTKCEHPTSTHGRGAAPFSERNQQDPVTVSVKLYPLRTKSDI